MAAAPTMLAFPPDIWERAIEHLPAEQRAQFTWRIPHMRQSLSRLGTQPLDGTAVEDATADVVVTVAAMMPALRKIPAFDELLRELPAHIDSTLDTLRSALDDDSAFAALRWTGRRLQSLFRHVGFDDGRPAGPTRVGVRRRAPALSPPPVA